MEPHCVWQGGIEISRTEGRVVGKQIVIKVSREEPAFEDLFSQE